MSLQKYKAAIFDMDGLLFDTESSGRWAWEKALEAYGYVVPDQLYGEFVGRDLRWREKILKRVYGTDFPFEAVKTLRIEIGDAREVEEGVPWKPGAFEVLNFIKDRRIKMGVATGTIRERAMRRFAQLKIEDYFLALVTSEDVANGKPAPDIFLETSRRMGVAPSSCVIFEDSCAGIRAASEAGALPIMVPDLEQPVAEIVNLPYRILPSLEGQTRLLETLFVTGLDMDDREAPRGR